MRVVYKHRKIMKRCMKRWVRDREKWHHMASLYHHTVTQQPYLLTTCCKQVARNTRWVDSLRETRRRMSHISNAQSKFSSACIELHFAVAWLYAIENYLASMTARCNETRIRRERNCPCINCTQNCTMTTMTTNKDQSRTHTIFRWCFSILAKY